MHVHDIKTGSVLKWSVAVMLALALGEAVAGYLAGSLALVSDAGHNFTDSLALVLAWFAFYVQSKPPTRSKTYGYHRAGVLAAFVNALLLVVLAGYVFYEAYHRLMAPHVVNAQWMMVVGGVGFLADAGVSIALLRQAHGDVNVRTAFVHTAADAVSTLGIVIGGWLIARTGIQQIDAVLGFLIGGLILWSSVGIIRETLNILLEGAPQGIHLDAVVASLRRIEGVEEVHDVHIWSLGSHSHAMSGHVGIANIPPSESNEILRRINAVLDEQYHISHTTIQFEHAACEPNHVSHKCYAPEEAVSHRGTENEVRR
jgi:cobalt-zinc-cadmium efflux system protein